MNAQWNLASGSASTNAGAAVLPAIPLGLPGLPVAEGSASTPILLWVDDSRLLLSLYQAVFESLGFEVVAISSPREALQQLGASRADVAIVDYDMPEMDGGTLASMMKARFPMLPVILYSGNVSIPKMARRQVDALCSKAAPRQELLATIEQLSLKAGNRRLRSFA